MKRFILLVVIIICVVLTGCQAIEKEEKIDVNATVTDMRYRVPYVTKSPMYNSKTMSPFPKLHPAFHMKMYQKLLTT